MYCGIAQDLRPLFPGVQYKLTFQAKGTNVGMAWFGGGPEWKRRFPLPEGDFDWRTFTFEFEAPKDANSYHFRVNVDSPTEALWLDDFRMSADLSTNAPLTRPVDLSATTTVPVEKLTGFICDGSGAEWLPAAIPIGTDDGIDASLRLAWTADALLLLVEVQDSELARSPDAASMWSYDSLQVSIDPRNEKTVGSYGANDFELGFGMGREGPFSYAWQLPKEGADDVLGLVEFQIGQQGEVTTYEVCIPWKALGMAGRGGEALGLNIVLNDRDSETDRAATQWSKGR